MGGALVLGEEVVGVGCLPAVGGGRVWLVGVEDWRKGGEAD